MTSLSDHELPPHSGRLGERWVKMGLMGDIANQITTQRRPLPSSLTKDIEAAGYYPALVADVVESAVAGGEVISHLVHQETTFDHDPVRRHITVLALTPTRLVGAHADDHAAENDLGEPDDVDPQSTATATATSECVPLSAVRGVMPVSYTHLRAH